MSHLTVQCYVLTVEGVSSRADLTTHAEAGLEKTFPYFRVEVGVHWVLLVEGWNYES